jgi:hypothetical protein
MKYLFIGGPADGERIEINCKPGKEPPWISIPNLKELEPNLTAMDFISENKIKEEVSIHEYKRETLYEHEGSLYPVYVSMEVKSFIQQLLIGYQRVRK